MSTEKPYVCIYHGNCADGFAAAWVVREVLGENVVAFYPGVYGEPPPRDLIKGKIVYIVDFSYKRAIIEEMAEIANTILILDHHKTAQEDLVAPLPSRVSVVFDMERSGAMLTWDYFYPTILPPMLLLHIEDRDLWRFNLHKTREIQAAVFSYPYDFKVWDKLMEADLMELAKEGEAIERKHFKDINELLKVCTGPLVIGGYVVDCANLPYTMASDAGHILASKEHNAFGATYYDTPLHRVFSLRSTDEGIDVSKIAKFYGGGGHRNAAGFKVTHAVVREMMLNHLNHQS